MVDVLACLTSLRITFLSSCLKRKVAEKNVSVLPYGNREKNVFSYKRTTCNDLTCMISMIL